MCDKVFLLKFRLCIKCSSFFAWWYWSGVNMSHCSLSLNINLLFQNVNLSFQNEKKMLQQVVNL